MTRAMEYYLRCGCQQDLSPVSDSVKSAQRMDAEPQARDALERVGTICRIFGETCVFFSK